MKLNRKNKTIDIIADLVSFTILGSVVTVILLGIIEISL